MTVSLRLRVPVAVQEEVAVKVVLLVGVVPMEAEGLGVWPAVSVKETEGVAEGREQVVVGRGVQERVGVGLGGVRVADGGVGEQEVLGDPLGE